MTSNKVLEICFVKSDIHLIAESKYRDLTGHLIRLNNYDHVTADLFHKLKIVLENPDLSRFKKPTPKICLACCNYINGLQLEPSFTNKRKYSSLTPTPQPSASVTDTSFDKLLNEIKTRNFTEDELNILMQAVGERLAPLANKYVATVNKSDLGSRLEGISTMTYQSYWNTSLQPLKYILLGMINGIGKRTESQETRNSRIRLAVHAMETIFAMTNLNYTSAIILSEMLYMYFLSNSRRVCEIYGAVTGGGTSTTLQNALKKISKSPQIFPNDGYIVVAFDNNQVLAKTHRVELGCKLKVSVVTSLAAFELLDLENPQRMPMRFPLLYQISPNDASALNQKLQQFTSSSLKLVNVYLLKYLQRRLSYIAASLSEDGSDFVDDSNSIVPKDNQGLPYEDISEMPSSCKVYDQECLLLNPNSHNTVREVLEHIQKIAVCESRRWVTVVVDGVPFTLAQDIIRNTVYCHICKEVLREKEISDHYIASHNEPSPPQLQRVFTNILLRPGAGHYEINMLKALFAGWFPLYLEPVAELLGFLSPKAKWCVQNCTDHHKAWQILEITFESLSDELLHSYAKFCREQTPPLIPTLEGFIQKVNDCENENVKAAFQFVYYWCFSILLFRGGIRKNNFDVAIKAREQASGLFYAFRHPKYQVINSLDVAELVQMPVDVRNTVFRESMVIPGSNVGQGIDFLLEQRNRRMKNYVIRNGIPTGDQWKAASSSMQRLDKIIEVVEERLNLPMSSSKHRLDHSIEKQAARSLFRRHGIFNFSTKSNITLLPDTQNEARPFNSILRCQSTAETNRKAFYEEMINTGHATVSCYVSLFKSDAEAEVVNDWGITKLRAATKTMLKYLPKELHKEINSDLKSSDKEKLREVYWRVYNLFEEEELDET